MIDINKPNTITDDSLGKITKKSGEDAVAGFPHEVRSYHLVIPIIDPS
jgi:hypothetical protein